MAESRPGPRSAASHISMCEAAALGATPRSSELAVAPPGRLGTRPRTASSPLTESRPRGRGRQATLHRPLRYPGESLVELVPLVAQTPSESPRRSLVKTRRNQSTRNKTYPEARPTAPTAAGEASRLVPSGSPEDQDTAHPARRPQTRGARCGGLPREQGFVEASVPSHRSERDARAPRGEAAFTEPA